MTIAMVTLGISIAALAGLVGFKWVELRTRRVFFESARRILSGRLERALFVLASALPRTLTQYAGYVARRSRVLLRTALASLLLSIERGLERALRALRHKTDPVRGGGPVSPFLREVVEYKRRLSHPKHLR